MIHKGNSNSNVVYVFAGTHIPHGLRNGDRHKVHNVVTSSGVHKNSFPFFSSTFPLLSLTLPFLETDALLSPFHRSSHHHRTALPSSLRPPPSAAVEELPVGTTAWQRKEDRAAPPPTTTAPPSPAPATTTLPLPLWPPSLATPNPRSGGGRGGPGGAGDELAGGAAGWGRSSR